jgi:Trypsin-co-occurring domain 1
MSEVHAGIDARAEDSRAVRLEPELIQTSIGGAVVYFRVENTLPCIVADGEVRAVAALDENAFEAAAKVIRESVRVIGSQLHDVGAELMPSELTVELGFTFAATGKATIVPVFLTGETKGELALKVTAKWKHD